MQKSAYRASLNLLVDQAMADYDLKQSLDTMDMVNFANDVTAAILKLYGQGAIMSHSATDESAPPIPGLTRYENLQGQTFFKSAVYGAMHPPDMLLVPQKTATLRELLERALSLM